MRRATAWGVLAAFAGFSPLSVSANDGAAAVTAGGIVLRDEHRVAMKNERLFISQSRVEVEYEFVNDSRDDVVTEVAFPLPDQGQESVNPQLATFDDFQVWADGKPVTVHREIKAVLEGRDITSQLVALGVKDFLKPLRDRDSVTAELHDKLVEAGLAPKGYTPAWEIRVLFHWKQRFPPGRPVKIRHVYRPVAGAYNSIYGETFTRACVDESLATALLERLAAWRSIEGTRNWKLAPYTVYVNYVLTTAKTWKMPIRDFELVVERGENEFVSFCWGGPVKKFGPTTFTSVMKDFIPDKNLTVYFFHLPPAGESKPATVNAPP